MSTATETCACGASITVDVRDGLVLGFRLAEWRKEHQHDDEVTRLRNWKAEALAVLAEWDGVYEALGSPATLGERKSTASFREAKRLLKREACVRELCDQARSAMSLPPVDCFEACDDGPCVCSGVPRVIAWTLNPEQVRAALDGGAPAQ